MVDFRISVFARLFTLPIEFSNEWFAGIIAPACLKFVTNLSKVSRPGCLGTCVELPYVVCGLVVTSISTDVTIGSSICSSISVGIVKYGF